MIFAEENIHVHFYVFVSITRVDYLFDTGLDEVEQKSHGATVC